MSNLQLAKDLYAHFARGDVPSFLAGCDELTDQGARGHEIASGEALGEPTEDRSEHTRSTAAVPLSVIQPGQARCPAQLERLCLA